MGSSRSSMVLSLSLVTLAFALLAGSAQAQVSPGVRAGLSVNPDQVYVGGHIQTSPLVDRLRFRPNLEVGIGDDVTLVAFNFEFVYPFPSRQAWHLYVGAGPAVNDYVFENSSETEAGFNMIIGAEHQKGLFFELKVGAMDSPDLKFGVGYTFR